MAKVLGVTRNIEFSCIQYIEDVIKNDGDWSGITVVAGFNRAYNNDVSLPIITVRVNDTSNESAEIGDTSYFRYPQVLVNLFCTSDSQRLDLKDFLVKKLVQGFSYNEYSITNGNIHLKGENGKIIVQKPVRDNPESPEMNKNTLHRKDRFRHLITLSCMRPIIES